MNAVRHTNYTGRASVRVEKHYNRVNFALLVMVAIATVAAYHRVLFNFFAGDDYYHLAWLAAAAKDPSLTLSNFTGSWLGGVVTHFYRPMISIVMLLDYLCWGNNATGYHVTNLICLLLTSLFLYFIFDSVCDLSIRSGKEASSDEALGGKAGGEEEYTTNESEKTTTDRLWPVAAAGLFALYPLHPEAVSWIIGRVDVLSTLFYTGSLLCYIRWRTTNKVGYLVVSLVTGALGLLSKEMVVTLPFVMLAFEVIFRQALNNSDAAAMSNSRGGHGANLLQTFRVTAPFWLLLACYALVRRLALGTFVGGYDVSWTYVRGTQLFIQTWLHSLRMMFVPINHDFLGARNWHTRAWEVFIIISAISLVAALLTNPRYRRLLLFLSCWFVLALAPVFHIFCIGDELQGGRFGYLSSAPLSGLLLLGYFFVNTGTIGTMLLRLCVPCFLLLSANLLYINNEAWHADGVQLSAIDRQLAIVLKDVPADHQVLLLNLPDNIHGAYACRNAVGGILLRAGTKIDAYHCVALNRQDNSFPSGFLKDSIAANTNRILFLWWDPSRLSFVQVNPPTEETASYAAGLVAPSMSPLRAILRPVAIPGVVCKWLSDGSLYVESNKPGVRPYVDLSWLVGKKCWSIDFVSMRVTVPPGGSTGGVCGSDLIYANDSNLRLGDLHYREHAALVNKPGTQTTVFALRGDEAWTFGGTITGCAILLPDQCRLCIENISAVAPDKLIPHLSIVNGDYMHSKGFLHLDREHSSNLVQFDVSGITGARGISVELSRPNVFFEFANPAGTSNTVGSSFYVPGTKGEFSLNLSRFPTHGYYSLRLRALDGTGKKVGLASDHIVVLVNL